MKSLIAILLLAVAPGLAHAQGASEDFPSRPIRLIVPFSAGGVIDIVARLVAPKLQERLGQPVIVENRPGAGGKIAAEAVAQAPADGHVLLVGGTSYTINPSLRPQLAVDILNTLAPACLLNEQQYVLISGPAARARTLEELVALAKARPGSLSGGISGAGTMAHLATELFKTSAQIDFVGVTYKGSGQMINDLLGGQIAFALDPIASHISNIQSGKVRPLAVAGRVRSPLLPEVPTFLERKLPVEASGWVGLFAPHGTPVKTLRRISDAARWATSLPDIKERFVAAGVEPSSSTPEEFARHVKSEIEKWGRIIRERGITIN
ncbi:MAG: Bug family tripartite tricarboxylate transporter substrate binding protein [Betaproteobacteria bacterium]